MCWEGEGGRERGGEGRRVGRDGGSDSPGAITRGISVDQANQAPGTRCECGEEIFAVPSDRNDEEVSSI